MAEPFGPTVTSPDRGMLGFGPVGVAEVDLGPPVITS